MNVFYKSMMVVLVAVFLSACETTGNPMFNEQYSEALTGKSVWFADDNTNMIEISGSTALVTPLYSEYFDMDYYDFETEEEYYEAYDKYYEEHGGLEQRVAYVNRVGNDGSLHIMKDGDTEFYTVGAFSHNATEMDIVNEGTAMKYVKAPSLVPADYVGKWKSIFYEEDEYEEFSVFTMSENSYVMEDFYVDHNAQEYEYYVEYEFPFELVDGYKFVEEGDYESDNYIYFVKSFEPQDYIEYIDVEGYTWKEHWMTNDEVAVPAHYKKIDPDYGYGGCDDCGCSDSTMDAVRSY